MSNEDIQKQIDFLLNKIQAKTGVSDQELIKFKKILDLADFSEDDK